MTALIEFECRSPLAGYEIISFDQRKARPAVNFGKVIRKQTPHGYETVYPPELMAGLQAVDEGLIRSDSVILAADATDDERYAAQRWGRRLLFRGKDGSPPRTLYILRPLSKRTHSFDLFERGAEVFLELAQVTTENGLKGFTKGDNEEFFTGLKTFVDRYGPIVPDDFFGSLVSRWWVAIVEMRRAISLWGEALRTGDFGKLIRCLEEHGKYHRFDREAGVGANVLLKKDPLGAFARLCIRPPDLRSALWTQLALAIDGHINLRSCVECRSWFTLEAGRGRSDKEYCSDACRMRAYRKRKSKVTRKHPGARRV